MPTIIGVHGIAQQFRGGYELSSVWYDAIRDGLAAAGHQATADMLAKDDVDVAFFGSLFRPPGTMAVGDPPFTASDVKPGLERDLLTEFYQAAVAQDPSLSAPAGAMGPGKEAIQVMLARLLRSTTFANVAQRVFIGNLKQVSQFLSDHSVKEQVLARVHDRIDVSTRVLIGHSLGSVVTYEYLCRYRPPSVELLITLGSPLGIPNLVFDKLTPSPADGKGAWPGTTISWVNIADPDDIVALRKQLAGLFAASPRGTNVDDRLVDNGDQPHAIARYLNVQQTGSALNGVLH